MAETDCWNFEALVLAADILQGGNLLLSHSRHHGHNKVLPFGETILELCKNCIISWQAKIVLGLSIVGKQTHETIIRDVNELVVGTHHLGNITIVRRGYNILKLLSGEDVDGDKVTLSVTVLSSLGSGHLYNLAGPPLDDEMSTLADGTGLLGEGLGRAGVGLGLKLVLIVRHGEKRAAATGGLGERSEGKHRTR